MIYILQVERSVSDISDTPHKCNGLYLCSTTVNICRQEIYLSLVTDRSETF